MKIRALLSSTCALALSAAGRLALAQTLAEPASLPRLAPRLPAVYGTTATSYVSVGSWQFAPINSDVTYDDLGAGAARASRFATGGLAAFAAPLDLPNGALLVSVEFDLCDANASNNHVEAALEFCDLLGDNCVVVGTLMGSVSNPTTPCARYTQDLSGLSTTIDNLTGRLLLLARTHSFDETNSISGALVGYKLQVSPAPEEATFGDVPKTHLYFRAIEALAASGITSGCGSGNFCPEQPVTRGEIAKFLANALGLQHP
jgi:hypothetical protein